MAGEYHAPCVREHQPSCDGKKVLSGALLKQARDGYAKPKFGYGAPGLWGKAIITRNVKWGNTALLNARNGAAVASSGSEAAPVR